MSQERKQNRVQKFLKQALCSHPHVSHYTSMPGLRDLQDLFSGRITSDQYSKLATKPLSVSGTVCSRCGAEWKR